MVLKDIIKKIKCTFGRSRAEGSAPSVHPLLSLPKCLHRFSAQGTLGHSGDSQQISISPNAELMFCGGESKDDRGRKVPSFLSAPTWPSALHFSQLLWVTTGVFWELALAGERSQAPVTHLLLF